VREVLLMSNDSPLVYARSILPLDTLRGRYRRLRRLGRTPLGKVLFSDPSMTRGDMQFAQFRLGREKGAGGQLPIWGRRSIFYLVGKPLLVSEIFLPRMNSLCRVDRAGI
jgi:chorismate--pyruvate lyase